MAGPVQCHVGAIDIQKLTLNGKRNNTHQEIVNKKTKKNMKGLEKNKENKVLPNVMRKKLYSASKLSPNIKTKINRKRALFINL